VERETAERPDALMQITPDEGALLTMLARLTGARRALEVGMFTGYSANSIARADGGRQSALPPTDEFASIARRSLRGGRDRRPR
jgi:caffeoyl-CoA O-methyltransferase